MTQLPPSALVKAVHDELAVPGRYHLHVAAQRPSLLGQAWQWIWQRVSDFLHALFSHVHVSGGARSAAGIAIVALCAIAFVAIAINLFAQIQLERTRRGPVVPMLSARSAQAFVQDAARAAEQGDYARAVRALFIAAVVSLDVYGAVNDEEAATVNDLRRALAQRHAQLEPPFTDLARAYTRAAYAGNPLDRESYERASAAYGMLERGLRA